MAKENTKTRTTLSLEESSLSVIRGLQDGGKHNVPTTSEIIDAALLFLNIRIKAADKSALHIARMFNIKLNYDELENHKGENSPSKKADEHRPGKS